jgi:hypothetical protein
MRDRFHTLAVRATLYALAGMALLFSPGGQADVAPFPTGTPRVLDAFEDASTWSVIASTQVTGVLRPVDGVEGKALCLDYDFHGVSGYVGIKRALPLDYPADYAFDFQMRGDSPPNNLEFKLDDASGDNVWWVQRPMVAFPKDWTPVRYKKRHVSKAWGPSPQTELTHSASLEFTLSSGSGGKGSVCFDQLRFTALVPDDGSPLAFTRSIEARDRNELVLDLGRVREFGGLSLRWPPLSGHDYRVLVSDDRVAWRNLRNYHGDGGDDWLALPESEARYLKLATTEARTRDALPQLGVVVEPLAFGASTNAFLQEVAKRSPRGDWPRGFSGEQPYWTLVGIDGGRQQGLIGEDGAIELGKGGPSIEPFVFVDGQRVGWSGVNTSQSLQDAYLPIPSVSWQHPAFRLTTSAFARTDAGGAQLVGRYRIENVSATARDFELALVLRPLQVNPPAQFLNTTGGFSPLRAIDADLQGAMAGGLHAGLLAPDWSVHLVSPADDAVGLKFDAGDLRAIPFGQWPMRRSSQVTVDDPQGLGSVAWRYRLHLAPGESRELGWWSPLDAGVSGAPVADLGEAQSSLATQWHDKLDAVQFRVPPQGQRMIETLRHALATILISRTGPRLQPGTRSYARAWIRDGAMIDEALLRMGREDVARDFVSWYAPYQFKDGKVPCCVDDRGSDPVPENDSHGELVYAIAEVYRYTQDKAWLEQQWPHVLGAIAYIDQLRASERTEANRATNPAFYGLMPASISHEGYSAKAMHSYWDDFWALRGYKDAVRIAQWLGHEDEARRVAASRDQFASDLRNSLAIATQTKSLDFIPGSAELGDFDPTSTTIALAPADAADVLPPGLLQKSFERYWQESQARADGTRAWKDCTPYELRTLGTFVRLGQPERAHALLDFFFRGQQPGGWRQWAEVVSGTPRKPFFLGDLPHAWVASDYVRSVLDMFAYERESDDALVLAAGIPLDWLDGEGVAVDGLRTPQGPISYSLRRVGDQIEFDLRKGSPPPGGFVLSLPPIGIVEARIGGKRAKAAGHELRIARAPANVTLKWQPAVSTYFFDKAENGSGPIVCWVSPGPASRCNAPDAVMAALSCDPTRSAQLTKTPAFSDCMRRRGFRTQWVADVFMTRKASPCTDFLPVEDCPADGK